MLPHRYNIPQSPNDATIGNPNRFAPPARAEQFRRFSHLGETSLESRVIRSSCGVVGVIFLASFLIVKLTNWLQEKCIYIGDYHSSSFFPPFARRGLYRGVTPRNPTIIVAEVYVPTHCAETDDLFSLAPLDLSFELDFYKSLSVPFFSPPYRDGV